MRPKVLLFMPAYHAAKSLERVYRRIPHALIDEVFVSDDASTDDLESVARKLGLPFERNPVNLGYGGNVRKCLQRALRGNCDVMIELHPDDQYDPSAIPPALEKIDCGFDFVLGSRFLLPTEALKHKMPLWKFAINRLSSLPARWVLGVPLTDFHTGFRVYHRRFLEAVPLQHNDSDYLFSFQIIAQAAFFGFRIGEVPVTCRYYPGVTQINFAKSMKYGLDASRTLLKFASTRAGRKDPLFEKAPVFTAKS